MSVGSMSGSHRSSSSTSRLISLSERMLASPSLSGTTQDLRLPSRGCKTALGSKTAQLLLCGQVLSRLDGRQEYCLKRRTNGASNPARKVDANAIFNLRYAGRAPGRPLRLFALRPRSDAASQDHLAAVGLDADAAGIKFGCASERLLDLTLDIDRRDLRSHQQTVANTLDPPHSADRLFGAFALVVPLHFPF